MAASVVAAIDQRVAGAGGKSGAHATVVVLVEPEDSVMSWLITTVEIPLH